MAAGLGLAHQDGIDLRLLAATAAPGVLPTGDAHRVAARIFEDVRADQPVIDDDIGFLELALRLEGQQFGVAGARADEADASGCAVPRRRDELLRPLRGTRRRRATNASRMLPKKKRCQNSRRVLTGRDFTGYALTQASGCLRQRSQKRGQRCLDLAADALRQDGCSTLRTDGYYEGIAVHDRRHKGVREFRVIDDVDENVALAGFDRNALVDFIFRRREHASGTFELGGGEFAPDPGDVAADCEIGQLRMQLSGNDFDAGCRS